MGLSAKEQQQYAEEGYVVVAGLLNEADLEPVRQAIAAGVEKQAQSLAAADKIRHLYPELPFTRRLAAIQQEAGEEPPIWNKQVFSRAIYDLLVCPRILDVVEALIGPEITVNGDYWVRPKLPEGKISTYPWHQDSAYYGPESVDIPILTVWVPLVDVDERNGCLKVLPGSHTWGLRPTRWVGPHLVPTEDVEARVAPITLPMRAGDLVVLSQFTFHGSLMNHSEDVRWSIDLRYSPTGPDMAWLFNRYPGFMARSRQRPEQVDTFEAWKTYRNREGTHVLGDPVDEMN